MDTDKHGFFSRERTQGTQKDFEHPPSPRLRRDRERKQRTQRPDATGRDKIGTPCDDENEQEDEDDFPAYGGRMSDSKARQSVADAVDGLDEFGMGLLEAGDGGAQVFGRFFQGGMGLKAGRVVFLQDGGFGF